MGAVDLVVQVGSPPSVASGLQRVGRAGHQVGAVSRGVVFPTLPRRARPGGGHRAADARAARIEALQVPTQPARRARAADRRDGRGRGLDASTTSRRVVRRAAPFAGARRRDAARRARHAGRAVPERGVRRAAARGSSGTGRATCSAAGPARCGSRSPAAAPSPTAACTASSSPAARTTSDVPVDAERSGGRSAAASASASSTRRWSTSRGSATRSRSARARGGSRTSPRTACWSRPRPGVPGPAAVLEGRLPRPARPSWAGRWARGCARSARCPTEDARARVEAAGLDAWAADNLLAYLREQREATGELPDRHAPSSSSGSATSSATGASSLHSPVRRARCTRRGRWSLGARLRERYGVDAAAMHSDDGIVLRLPDMLDDGGWRVWDSASTAAWAEQPRHRRSTWRTCSSTRTRCRRGPAELGWLGDVRRALPRGRGRALLLPRRRPDRRQPLWQQRQRSAQLLAVAAAATRTSRSCSRPSASASRTTSTSRRSPTLMRDVARRPGPGGRGHDHRTPSPFAQSLLFGYTAQFLYDGDAPLAERRAAALTLDPTLLAELLGPGRRVPARRPARPRTRSLRTEAELSGTRAGPPGAARSRSVADVVRRHGPLTADELAERTQPEVRERGARPGSTELEGARRADPGAARRRRPERAEQWAAVEDAGRLRDALGVALPVGVPEVFTEVVAGPARRPACAGTPARTDRSRRRRSPTRFGLGVAVVAETSCAGSRAPACSSSGPAAAGRRSAARATSSATPTCCATLRRRSLAALRAEVEPVAPQALGVFLPRWQGVQPVGRAGRGSATGALRGVDGVAARGRAAGRRGRCRPRRSRPSCCPRGSSTTPRAMLDELTAAGEVALGRARRARRARRAGLACTPPRSPTSRSRARPERRRPTRPRARRRSLEALAGGGACFLGALAERVRQLRARRRPSPSARPTSATALWDLVWTGHVTNDGLAPLRAWLGTGSDRAPHPRRRPARARRCARGSACARPSSWPATPARGRPRSG